MTTCSFPLTCYLFQFPGKTPAGERTEIRMCSYGNKILEVIITFLLKLFNNKSKKPRCWYSANTLPLYDLLC